MIIFLSCLSLLFPSLDAFEPVNASCCHPGPSNWCQLGSSGFSTLDPSNWYEIETFSYPTATLLSLNRNHGSTQGNVQLTDNGLIIGQSGNYSVSVQAILQNNGEEAVLIPMFLVQNGSFDPSAANLGGVGVLLPGIITTIQSTGILENVTPGTSLSLIATNGGSDDALPITVVGWGISVFRIPCDPAP